MLVNRVIDKDELIRKVHNMIESLQKEIKEVYSLFKPLIEKGLPHFWDVENMSRKKEQYEDSIVSKRNDQSNFEDLEGNLRGDVIVAKLGDLFDLLNMYPYDLLNMARRVKLPKPVVEDYINL